MTIKKTFPMALLVLFCNVATGLHSQNTYRIISSLDQLNEEDTYAIYALRKPNDPSRMMMGNKSDSKVPDYMETVTLYAEETEDFNSRLIYINNESDIENVANIHLKDMGNGNYALHVTGGTAEGYLKNESGYSLELSNKEPQTDLSFQWIPKYGKNAQVVYFLNARTNGNYIMAKDGQHFYANKLTNWGSSSIYLGVLCKLISTGGAPTGIDSSLKTEGHDVYYTLDGRRMSGKPTQHGIFLKNGKKLYLK